MSRLKFTCNEWNLVLLWALACSVGFNPSVSMYSATEYNNLRHFCPGHLPWGLNLRGGSTSQHPLARGPTHPRIGGAVVKASIMAVAGRATAVLLGKILAKRQSFDNTTIRNAFAGGKMLDMVKRLEDFACAQMPRNLLRNDSWVISHQLAANIPQMSTASPWTVARRADGEGVRELHVAAERGMVATIRVLVCHGGVDPCGQSRYGQTALHIAAARGHVNALEALCELAGAAPSRPTAAADRRDLRR